MNIEQWLPLHDVMIDELAWFYGFLRCSSTLSNVDFSPFRFVWNTLSYLFCVYVRGHRRNRAHFFFSRVAKLPYRDTIVAIWLADWLTGWLVRWLADGVSSVFTPNLNARNSRRLGNDRTSRLGSAHNSLFILWWEMCMRCYRMAERRVAMLQPATNEKTFAFIFLFPILLAWIMCIFMFAHEVSAEIKYAHIRVRPLIR